MSILYAVVEVVIDAILGQLALLFVEALSKALLDIIDAIFGVSPRTTTLEKQDCLTTG